MTVQLQIKDDQVLTGKALKNNAHCPLEDHPQDYKEYIPNPSREHTAKLL
jgi:hypothetical protein